MGNQQSVEPLPEDIPTLFGMLYAGTQQLYIYHLTGLNALNSGEQGLIDEARHRVVNDMNRINPKIWSLEEPWPNFTELVKRYQVNSENKTLVRQTLQADIPLLLDLLRDIGE